MKEFFVSIGAGGPEIQSIDQRLTGLNVSDLFANTGQPASSLRTTSASSIAS